MTPSPRKEPAPAPRRIHFSTEAVKPAQRFSFWKEVICTSFVRLELECERQRPFHATLAARPMSRFDSIEVGGSAQRVTRSERLVGEDRTDSLILMRQHLGDCIVAQDGQELHMSTGGLALVDSRRPYSLCFPDEFSQTVIRVPAALLEQRLGRSTACTRHALAPGSTLAKLVGLAIDELGREEREHVSLPLSNIAFDLLALALLESAPANAAAPRMAELRVTWAKAQVLDNLRDPQLSPQAVAERQGVSPRLLQRLFATEGESLAEFILAQRLQRCREALRDTAQARRSITEIALSWGFNDPAHFSKAFRRRFGVSPRDFRPPR